MAKDLLGLAQAGIDSFVRDSMLRHRRRCTLGVISEQMKEVHIAF